MRSAPAVSVRCSNDAAWRSARTLLPALAAGVACVWALLRVDAAGWPVGCLALATALAAGGGSWRASSQLPAVLAWDGTGWSLDGQPGHAAMMIDLGSWMLLRFQPLPDGRRLPLLRGPRPLWFGLGPRAAGPVWHGLRVALYAWRPEPVPAPGAPDRAA